MKDLKDYITESIKPPRLSAKNKHLWKNGILDKERVMKWLNDNCWFKGEAEIVDGKINIKGDVGVKDDVEEFPYPFGEVTGVFSCTRCRKLKSLRNSPQKVGKFFSCSNCESLTSLEGAPNEVVDSFYCHTCINLKSLEGAPQKVGGYFDCSYCDTLTSLEGAPKEVGKSFFCNVCGEKFTVEDVRKVCKVKEKIRV